MESKTRNASNMMMATAANMELMQATVSAEGLKGFGKMTQEDAMMRSLRDNGR